MTHINVPNWLGSISIEQVEVLEGIFATLTEGGWVIPQWLIDMRQNVTVRDASLHQVDNDVK